MSYGILLLRLVVGVAWSRPGTRGRSRTTQASAWTTTATSSSPAP